MGHVGSYVSNDGVEVVGVAVVGSLVVGIIPKEGEGWGVEGSYEIEGALETEGLPDGWLLRLGLPDIEGFSDGWPLG